MMCVCLQVLLIVFVVLFLGLVQELLFFSYSVIIVLFVVQGEFVLGMQYCIVVQDVVDFSLVGNFVVVVLVFIDVVCYCDVQQVVFGCCVLSFQIYCQYVMYMEGLGCGMLIEWLDLVCVKVYNYFGYIVLEYGDVDVVLWWLDKVIVVVFYDVEVLCECGVVLVWCKDWQGVMDVYICVFELVCS